MTQHVLQDSFGRRIGDLRISVTDRCNFRCRYCLPAEKVEWKPKAEILSYEELLRVATIAGRAGVKKLRITGGEPLLRPALPRFIEQLIATNLFDDIALTTNGQLLPRFAPALRAAGLSRLNISLDSLDATRFYQMTQRNALGAVLEGIASAQRAGFENIKVNAVVIRNLNDDEIISFAHFARQHSLTVRFIEFMPLDSGHHWTREQVVPGAEIVARLQKEFRLVPLQARDAAETARRFGFSDAPGEIGVITPVTSPFCGTCNRIRLTADGQLRTCLFSESEHDVRSALRREASDEAVFAFLAAAVQGKEAGHRINAPDFVPPQRSMSFIGG